MKMERIYAKNATYQRLEVLKTNRNKRYHYGQFFVEGVRNLNEAVRSGWEIVSFVYTLDHPLSEWAGNLLQTVPTQVNYVLTQALLADLSDKTDTSEVMAVVRMRPDDPMGLKLSACPLLMLFDRPSNRGNLGTIIRSCDAQGADGLILTGHAVDLYDPEVVVASMGSFFRLPVVRVARQETLDACLAQWRQAYPGFQCVGTTAHRELPIDAVDLTRPTLLVVGNETDGMSRAYREGCDVLATIPMAETASASSFNVACAATVLLYEACRQRRGNETQK